MTSTLAKALIITGIVLLVLSAVLYVRSRRLDRAEVHGSRLKNFYKIDDRLYRSDQPTAQDFKALEAYGIKEVLNLRYRHNDGREASGTNLRLHHIRTRASRISEEEITEALRIIHNSQGPILIHCWHGSDRTGAVVAMYRIVYHGLSKEEALHELQFGGFGYHKIFGNILTTIRNADVDKIKRDLGITAE